MIIDNVKNVQCYFPSMASDYYNKVKSVEVHNMHGAPIVITTNDGTEITIINTPCRITK